MITLPVVLIAAAVLLLLALLLGLFLQRRRTAGATPPGPRTVADLVQQRADRDPAPAPADPVGPAVEEPADAAPADAVASTVDEPAAAVGADPEPADDDEPPAPAPAPAPVTASRAIAPLGDDVPWRRAAQMSGTADAEPDPAPESEPEPTDVGRVPALALLRRPSRRPLPSDTRHPFLSSAPRLAVVPATPSAVAEVAAPVPAEATDTEPAAAEPAAAEPTGAEPADGDAVAAERWAAEPIDVEPVVAEPVDLEPTSAEPTDAESGHAEPVVAEQPGAGPTEADQTDVESTDVGPTHPEPPAEEPVGGDPDGHEQAADERTKGVPSRAVLPLVGSGLAAGAIVAAGAQVAAGRAGDHAAEPGRVDGDAAPAEPAAVVHNREIDVRGVADRPDHSHVDLVPVDGGPPEVDGSGRALVSANSDRASDAPPQPMTDAAEAQVAPDHPDSEPAAPTAAVAAPAALAGTAALALTRDAPDTEPDGFPSTDPDVLFDSPPEAPAADEPAPAPDDVTAAALAAAPLTWAPETPAPEASATESVTASEVQAEPGESSTASPATAPTTAHQGAAEPTRRSPRDPVHLAAEQAAADLALLRTFGDPSARPERAPIVALEGTTRPESPRPVGAAQPVRFRAVCRDGTEVAGAAVALLDDRGHEVGTGRTAAGELTAPHPGAYVLVATAPDHQPGAVALAVTDAPVDADVLLVRSAALVGVVSGEDGPLAGARVTLVQDGEVVDVAETDADGAYLVADLASGEYAVSVAAAGCDADVVLVVVADETECVHDVELEPAGVPAG